jgi:hypothetical protein
MADLPYLPQQSDMYDVLNTFEDSEAAAHQFLHGLPLTDIFEDHPITLSIIEAGRYSQHQNHVGDQSVTLCLP